MLSGTNRLTLGINCHILVKPLRRENKINKIQEPSQSILKLEKLFSLAKDRILLRNFELILKVPT